MDIDLAQTRVKEAGFQLAPQPSWVNSTAPSGQVVGTSPSGQTIPGSIVTIQVSNGIAPPPPPPPPVGIPGLDGLPPVQIGSTVVEIPGLPPITVPVLGPPPP
jgi:beta-lactam-binding protein with PASTA domain